MRHENEVPADRHPLTAPSALLKATLAFAVSAAIVFFLGPGWVIGWASTYLVPMVVLLGGVGLLMREAGKSYDEMDGRRSTNIREPRRGEVRGASPPRVVAGSVWRGRWVVSKTDDGFSRPVYRLLVCLSLLANVARPAFSGWSSVTNG